MAGSWRILILPQARSMSHIHAAVNTSLSTLYTSNYEGLSATKTGNAGQFLGETPSLPNPPPHSAPAHLSALLQPSKQLLDESLHPLYAYILSTRSRIRPLGVHTSMSASAILRPFQWFYTEFGLSSIQKTGRNAYLIILARACRMVSLKSTRSSVALLATTFDHPIHDPH